MRARCSVVARLTAVLGLLSLAACLQEKADPFTDPPVPCLPVVEKPNPTLAGIPAAPKKRQPAPWPLHISAGQAMAQHGGKLYVVDTDNGTLVRLDAATLQVEASVPVGVRPDRVVVDQAGNAYVGVRQEARIARVAADGTVQHLPVGMDPIGLALSESGEDLYVALGAPQRLLRVTTAPWQVAVNVALPERPIAVVLRGNQVLVTTAGKHVLAFAAPGLTSFGSVTLGDRTLANVCKSEEFGTGPKRHPHRALSATVDPSTGAVLVAHVVAIPGDAPPPEGKFDAAPMMTQPGSGECANEPVSSGGYGGGSSGAGGFGGFDCTAPRRPVEPAITVVATDLATRALQNRPVLAGDRTFASHFDQPTAIVTHPTLDLVFVAYAGTDNVLVLHGPGNGKVPSGLAAEVAQIRVGQAPRGLAVAPDGARLYVLESQGFRVSEVDLQPLASAVVGGLLLTPLSLVPARATAIGTDPLPDAARLGRRVFTHADNPRLSKAGQFACATCHHEGGDDKLVWRITDGPRQTPALAGRLDGTGPFNWKGTQDVLKHNMADTVHRMGGQGLTDAELTSLEQFLLVGLPAPQNPHVQPAGPTEAQARGKALFFDAEVGCASCHVPGKGTDGKSHDVGTASAEDLAAAAREGKGPVPARRFNTPSLRHLFATAPYFHDGSAATLQEALARTADTMGRTSHLTAGQRADLVAYLLTL